MQKIVLFIEETDKDYELAPTIANLYVNRFTIDEDVCHEIVRIYKVEKYHPNLQPEEKEQSGSA